MTDITEFPELDRLEQELAQLYKDSIPEAIDNSPELEDEIRALKLNEIIVFSSWANDNAIIGESRLLLGFVLDVPDEIFEGDPSDRDRFLDARDELEDVVDEGEIEWDLFNEWFDGFAINFAFLTNRDDFIIFGLNRTDSIQAYSLTLDAHLELEDNRVEASKAGAREDIEEDVLANDIIEYPELNDLRQTTVVAFNDALLESDLDEELFNIERIIVNEPWGNGTAVFGEDELSLDIIVSFEGTVFRGVQVSQQLDGGIQAGVSSGLIADNFIISDLMRDWFAGISFRTLEDDAVNLSRIIRRIKGQKLYDLFNDSILRIDDGELVEDELEEPEEPEEELIIEPEEPEEIEPEPEPAPEPEPEEPEPTLADLFPEIPERLRPFAEETDRLEVPAGKETKAVTPREMYDFEFELASPQGELEGGIGESMREGRFGFEDPPGTFPRTGPYLKYYLLNRGPAYVLQIYNDLVIYSAFISTMHGGRFRTGTYNSFRSFINRVLHFDDHGGPQLIRRLSPQEASANQLKQVPNHPTLDVDAPWLENRNYYDIIQDNANNSAWLDITGNIEELRAD